MNPEGQRDPPWPPAVASRGPGVPPSSSPLLLPPDPLPSLTPDACSPLGPWEPGLLRSPSALLPHSLDPRTLAAEGREASLTSDCGQRGPMLAAGCGQGRWGQFLPAGTRPWEPTIRSSAPLRSMLGHRKSAAGHRPGGSVCTVEPGKRSTPGLYFLRAFTSSKHHATDLFCFQQTCPVTHLLPCSGWGN